MNSFDCVVVGGGMVGAASALSLAQLGLKVAVVEKIKPQAFAPENVFNFHINKI